LGAHAFIKEATSCHAGGQEDTEEEQHRIEIDRGGEIETERTRGQTPSDEESFDKGKPTHIAAKEDERAKREGTKSASRAPAGCKSPGL